LKKINIRRASPEQKREKVKGVDGCWERVLRVDLTHGVSKEESVDRSVYKNFLGGSGLATKFFYEELAEGVGGIRPCE
jgi:aldehyde:ferredoxin oxidoreductase